MLRHITRPKAKVIWSRFSLPRLDGSFSKYSNLVSSPIKIKDYNSSYISIEFQDSDGSNVTNFSNFFLRDSCSLHNISIDPSSGQKLFTTGKIPTDIKPAKEPLIVQSENGDFFLKIQWDEVGLIGKESLYSADFLKKYSVFEKRRRGKVFYQDKLFWDHQAISKASQEINFNYKDYMDNENDFFCALKSINKYGLCFINNIPQQLFNSGSSNEWFIEKIANRIGYIRETFYGKLFDVKSIPDAKNIAYTNNFLPLHMDLLYYEAPPGLQLLHSIKNKTFGGENIFADSFHAATYIKEKDPQAFLALTTIPIAYQYHNDGEFYYYERPLIVEHDTVDYSTGSQIIKEVNYSPPFQAPFESGSVVEGKGDLLKDYIRGIKLFENFINDPTNQYQLKMQENSCVIFDNRRVLHSRNAFEYGESKDQQERWLKGCYLDTDTFMSRLRVYHEKLN
ncbi:hypothetical protein PACTADRAFT_48005 [Pachysolen tannophilus NRRL Y-2460]|uniref:TauD/TfdA-like domain-containing protein n=1 Tax=Pachysolen tannophilus NRRL Y-2460 TaxID=669874 RepID=A0A1E4U2H4_PACTA|nr:hypothetical protein PACTADRAFT_48005 [Pachysolen tannophilus NRRL Y-2460]